MSRVTPGPGRIELDGLAPRIRKLSSRQDELNKTRIQAEAEMAIRGIDHVDIHVAKAYAQDVHALLEQSDFIDLRSGRS